MKLYEINKVISQVAEMTDEDGCITEEWLALLNTAELTLTEKADNIWVLLQEKDNTIDNLKKEIERLSNWIKKETKQKEQLKDYLAFHIKELSPEGIQGEKFRFSFRKSESIEIINEEEIDNQFKKEKTTISVDKTAIKTAIKNWLEVKGAELKVNSNLQIK